ncbi:MAG: hypothetical protein ABW168_04980 [Sedimenticola sp.]
MDWWQSETLIKFESPTTINVCAPSNSGKTFFTMQLLQNADGMFKEIPKRIIYFYSVWQDIYDEMRRTIPNIVFHQHIPTEEEFKDYVTIDKFHSICVFDDLVDEMADSSFIQNVFCVYSHNYNTTIIYMVHNLFQKGKVMRTVSLNTQYFIIFANHRDKQQIQHFGRQAFPGKVKYLLAAYQTATSVPFGYLLVDLNAHSDKQYQLRSKILPNEDTSVFMVMK